MPDPNQPRENDAVLGGQYPPPASGVILGGLEGVKQRLGRGNPPVTSGTSGSCGSCGSCGTGVPPVMPMPPVLARIAALKEALKYGDAGLDLTIQGLQDEVAQVNKTAYFLLRKRTEPRVRQALREYNPWRFFECLCTLEGHSNSVCCLAISPDGHNLVSGSGDRTIKVWDVETAQAIHTLKGHSSCVSAVAISLDGQTLISGSEDKTIKVWNLPTGRTIRTLTGHSQSVLCAAISPDGQTVVSGGQNLTIYLWDLQTGQGSSFLSRHSDLINCLAISPDRQTLISGSGDRTIKV